MSKKKTEAPKVTETPIQTRWSVRVIAPGPEFRRIEGRQIHDTQIITLPDDQKYLDALDRAGLRYEMMRRA